MYLKDSTTRVAVCHILIRDVVVATYIVPYDFGFGVFDL